MSITALVKLLQHGVNSNDSRLTEITVKGDQVFSEGRSTRSSRQSKPEQWTEVPLLAKLLKLLINEIQNVMKEVLLLSIKLPWFYIILFLLRLLILMNLTMMSGKLIVRTVMPLPTPILPSRVWTSANCLLLLKTTLTMQKRKILTARLMYYIVLYMQITEEQCQKWSDNPDMSSFIRVIPLLVFFL